ncbi:MAG: hypothetical protein IKU29_08620 [Parabacteroides sp.]|nr:hypothetical protein [Parabacteroides sp.]
MNIEDLNICICTRSMNIDLYKQAMNTVDLPYKKKRYRFTTADGYLYDLVKSEYDYVVNIDEDAFVCNINALKDLIIYFIENGYVNCGMPDGGVSPVRGGNPIVTNPFFNIIDIKKIRERFSLKEIEKIKQISENVQKQYIPNDIVRLEYAFKENEPYCSFFIWIALNFKVLYLDADTYKDGYSTVLKNHKGVPFLIHSWYSRMYNRDDFHTKRINDIISSCPGKKSQEVISSGDKIQSVVDKLAYRFYFPIIRKIKRVLVKINLLDYC